MGNRIRWHQAGRRVSAVQEANSRSDARPRAPARFADFKPEYRRKIESLRSHALRVPEDWRCRIESQLEARRFIDLVRFTFARFRVARHLEELWLTPVEDDFTDRIFLPGQLRDPAWMHRFSPPDLRSWHLIAAQGGSLYRHTLHAWLSKQEAHHFLAAPPQMTSTKHAFWYAVARAQTEDTDVALSVARCKVASYSIASTWWKDVARYFARHPLSIDAMDDLVDFLFAAKRDDQAFTLKGRAPAALERRKRDWHRMLRQHRTIVYGGAWTGSPLPDVEYEVGKGDERAIWRIRQIKSGDELFREGQRMHHCVASYQSACMRGDLSIWSMTCEFPIGCVDRGVTMEITLDGRIVQCRGFANRAPEANEAMTAKHWAREHGLTWAVAGC
jgi:hypothetical protein